MITINETAVVDHGAEIGDGTTVWHFSHIDAGAKIGKNCTIGQNVYIASDVVIGDNVKIQNNVSIYNGITIGDNVFIGPSCVFTNVKNPRASISRKDEYAHTVVCEGATLGANSTIICGVTINQYAFVAAGAVVTKDVPYYRLVAGVPAKRIGYVTKEGLTVYEKDYD